MSTMFREAQRVGLVVLVPLALAMLAGPGLVAYLAGRALPPSLLALLLLPPVLVLLIGLMRLVTEVRDDGLHIRVFPFFRRRIPWDQIASASARTYRPLRDYGGWGLRWNRQGVAYTARGDRGVQLVLGDGRRVLIGSQRPEELVKAVLPRLSGER
jgi:hypothetical protein